MNKYFPLMLICLFYYSIGFCQQDQGVDLKLSFSTETPQPEIYSNFDVRLTIVNEGTINANNVRLYYQGNGELVAQGGNPPDASLGTESSGQWLIETLEAGASATLDLHYFLLGTSDAFFFAEIFKMDGPDLDSETGNNNPRFAPFEDDMDYLVLYGNPFDTSYDLQVSYTNVPSQIVLNQGSAYSIEYEVAVVSGDYGGNSINGSRTYLSRDAILDDRDLPVGNDGIFQIDNTSPNLRTVNLSFPANPQSGDYYLITKIDDFSLDDNLTNNFTVEAVEIVNNLLGYDNKILDAEFPAVVETGSSFEYSCTIQNLGSGNSIPKNLSVRLGATNASTSGQTSIDEIEVPIIQAGEVLVVNGVAEVPLDQQTGGYYLVFVLDAEGDAYVVDNRYGAGIGLVDADQPPLDLPDLEITDVVLPPDFSGGLVDITITVTNNGPGVYSEDYISTRVGVAGNQTGSIETYGDIIIQPGASVTYTDEINLSWFPGTYPVNFIVDVFNYIEESNESNNVYNVTVTFSDPDIFIDVECPEDVLVQIPNPSQPPSVDPCDNVTNAEVPAYLTNCQSGDTNISFEYEVLDGNIAISDLEGGLCGPLSVSGIGSALLSFTFMTDCGLVETCSYTYTREYFPHQFNFTNCPFVVVVEAAPGANSAAATWDDNFTFDETNCPAGSPDPTVSLNVGLPSGSEFPIGTTLVSYSATSCYGFIDNCIFNVIVEEGDTVDGAIDLELSLNQTTENPSQWSSYSVVATITNNGPETATGVVVDFSKPDGVVYVGADPFSAQQGTFDPFASQLWTVGNIPAQTSVSLTVNYFLLETVAPAAYAQVTSANEEDIDSSPGNGTPPLVNEDDEANTTDDVTPEFVDMELEARIEQSGNFGQSNDFDLFLTVKNAGSIPATGVSVEVTQFNGANLSNFYPPIAEQGSFDPLTEQWTIGTVNAGQELTLQLRFFLNPNTGSFKLSAQVETQNEPDLDSVPGNGYSAEDDEISEFPGRPCELSVEILNVECVSDPDPNISPALDEFFFEVEVSGAPDGWKVFFELYNPPNTSGEGDGTFTVGPVPRYMVSVGSTIYDLGFPGCSTPFTSFDIVEDVECFEEEIPELAFTNYELLSDEVEQGAVLDYEIDLANIGNAPANGLFTIKTYISTDPQLSPDDIQEGVLPTGNWPIGFLQENVSGAVTIPDNLPTGPYFLIVKLDADDDIVESNENNNIGVKSFVVTMGDDEQPDLELELSVDASEVIFAQNLFELRLKVRNNGNGAANGVSAGITELINANLFVNSLIDISQGDFDINTAVWNIGSIAAGADVTLRLKVNSQDSAPLNPEFFAFAEILNQEEDDLDSSPANGNGVVAQEDDEDAVPDRDCNIMYEVLDYYCEPDDDPNSPIPLGDKFYFDIEVTNAPDGWSIWLGLGATIISGEGDGLFSIGPITRYETAFGNIFDHGIPYCYNGDRPINLVQDVECTDTDPCTGINVTVNPGMIAITNVAAPHFIKKIFNPNWNTVLDCVDANCDDPSIINDLPGGTYFVQVQLFDVNWNPLCIFEEFAEVPPGSTPQGFARQYYAGMPVQISSIQPNPVLNGQADIIIYSQLEIQKQVNVFNLLGGLEETHQLYLEEGWNRVSLDVRKLTAGTYFLQLEGQHSRQMPIRMVVLRD